MTPSLLVLPAMVLAVLVALLLVRADRALNEARDIRHELLDDKRRSEDVQRRAALALRRLERLAEEVELGRTRTDEIAAVASKILRAEHQKARQRHG